MEDHGRYQAPKTQVIALFSLLSLLQFSLRPELAAAQEVQISRSTETPRSQNGFIPTSGDKISIAEKAIHAIPQDASRFTEETKGRPTAQHSGSSIPSSPISSFSNANLQLAESPAQEAQALAERVIEKLGGLDKIHKFNHSIYRAVGNVEQISSLSGSSNNMPCEIIIQGRKQLVSVTFMGQPVVTGYDGKECWTKQGKNVMPTDQITAQRVKEDLDHGLLLVEKLLEKGRQLKLEPPKVINGTKCDTLSAVADDGKPTIFYVDPTTSLIVRTEYHGSDIEQGVDCLKAYDYMDYRRVGGTLQPFKAIEYSDDKKVSIVEIARIETDYKPTEDVFKMPLESKIARLKSGPVKVPFQYTSNEILVMASINGLPGKLFIVDTGATQSIVDTQCFKDIAPTTSEEIAITTGSGAVKMGFAQLKTFQLGEVVLQDVPVAIADLSKFAQFLTVRPQGLIGANILKRFLITIDYEKQELLLRDPDKVKPPEDAIVVDTKPSLGVSGLAVEGVLDKKLKLSFLIDSGAAFNHVSESLIKELTQTPLLPVGVVKGLDGTPVKTGATRFQNLTIGKLSIDDPIFSVAPSNGNEESPKGILSGGALAIIGNPLLSQYRVTIDYRNQKIYFEERRKRGEAELVGRLKRILVDFYNQDNARTTTNQLSHLAADALAQGFPAIAAQALANEAYALSRLDLAYDSKNNSAQRRGTGANSETKAINDKFLTALENAKRSDNKAVTAQVFSLWAQYCLQSVGNAPRARQLINKALATCPTEPAVYAVAGLLFATGQTNNPVDKFGTATTDATILPLIPSEDKPESSADILLNQSLMLDPSNWLALWTKYDLAERNGKTSEKVLISKHLLRYYPDAIRVKRLME